MHNLYNLKESLIKELEDYGKEGSVSRSNIEIIDKLAHAAKNVAKVIECCEEDEYSMAMSNGYSRRGRYSRRGSYADGSSYGDMSNGENYFVRPDGSYARGRGAKRDSMGRYSGEGVDEHTKEELMKLIDRM